MKVIVDTNVLLSALWRDKDPEKVILVLLNQQTYSWMVSPEILSEYLQVLKRPKFAFSPDLLAIWGTLLNRDTKLVIVEESIELQRDPKDAIFLACALACDADYLITGDNDLLAMKQIGNTSIVPVPAFKSLVTE